MYQFDIVQQKQNLAPHQDVHPAMYMPSHGEFLIEVLSSLGLKPGLSFGLDDFALNGQCLEQSSSEIFIVCGADQHFSSAFLDRYTQLNAQHRCRILIVSEPIFSPLALFLDAEENAARRHLRFIEAFQPHFVLYLSHYDVAHAQRHFAQDFRALPYSLADPELMGAATLPWAEKQQALLWLGKPQAWTHNQWTPRGLAGKSREAQLQWLTRQQNIPFRGFARQYSFRECYLVANQYRFQVQPRAGYAFHTARTIQSALVGCIPVLLLPRAAEELLKQEAPQARPGHNLLVAWDGEEEALWEHIQDEALCQQIHGRLGELIGDELIGRRLFTLVQALQNFF